MDKDLLHVLDYLNSSHPGLDAWVASEKAHADYLRLKAVGDRATQIGPLESFGLHVSPEYKEIVNEFQQYQRRNVVNNKPMTLNMETLQARGTPNGVMLSGLMQVTEQLPRETAEVLRRLQEGTCEPWLAPRHEWMVKDGVVFAYFDSVESGQLWAEHDKTAALAAKGIALLERIMDIILATNGAASWNLLAEGADRIRKAGVPIVIDSKKD